MRNQLFVLSVLLFLIGRFRGGVVSAETATTITVCNSGCTTDIWGTAINLANSGDTIRVQSDLQVTQGAVLNGKTVTIQGNNHTVSKASGATGAFLGLIQSTVTMNNLTFRGGNNAVNGTNGGAVWAIEDSTLTLNSVEFYSNQAINGGALYVKESEITVRNSLFQGNSATGTQGRDGGGAIRAEESTVSIDDSKFQSNVTNHDGGAIFTYNSIVSVDESDFLLNSASSSGGAISWQTISSDLSGQPIIIDFTPDLDVFNSSFSWNSTDGGGGGLHFSGNSAHGLDVRKNLFNFNFANVGGGMFLAGGKGDQIIANNTLVDNRATARGGGLYWWYRGRLESNTIYRNQAPEAANVYFQEGWSTLTTDYKVRNNIIALPRGGGENCSDEDLDVTVFGSSSIYNNLDDDGSCDSFTIEADPMLRGLEDNGGSTFTMRPAPGSPVLGAADWDGTAVNDDQRGVYRGPGSISDLGAYERVVQNDCQVINQTIPGGSSTGLTKVSTFPSFLSGEIIDVDVTIELDNMYYLSDIFASVKSPGNLPLTIIDRPKYSPPDTEYGCFTGSLDAVFDNDGFYPTLDSSCTESGAGISGYFKPKNNLTSWNGTQTEGNWVLNVTDATSPFQAKLARWCVSVEYFPDSAVTTPTAVTLTESEAAGSPVQAIIVLALLLTLILSSFLASPVVQQRRQR